MRQGHIIIYNISAGNCIEPHQVSHGNALYNGKACSKSLMLTSGLLKSFIKQVLKFYKLRNNLKSINSHLSDARRMRRKNKTSAFCRSVALQRLVLCNVATFNSFKITELFLFMKAKKSPSDFLLFWSALKTFEIKQGS